MEVRPSETAHAQGSKQGPPTSYHWTDCQSNFDLLSKSEFPTTSSLGLDCRAPCRTSRPIQTDCQSELDSDAIECALSGPSRRQRLLSTSLVVDVYRQGLRYLSGRGRGGGGVELATKTISP